MESLNSVSTIKKILKSPTEEQIIMMLKSYPNSLYTLKNHIIASSSTKIIDYLLTMKNMNLKNIILDILIKMDHKSKPSVENFLKTSDDDYFSDCLKIKFSKFDVKDLYSILKRSSNQMPSKYLNYIYDKVKKRVYKKLGMETEKLELNYLYKSYAILNDILKMPDYPLIDKIVELYPNEQLTVFDIPILRMISSLMVDKQSINKIWPNIKHLIQSCVDVLDQIIILNNHERKYLQHEDLKILDTLLRLVLKCHIELQNIYYPQIVSSLYTNIPSKIKKTLLQIISHSNDNITIQDAIHKISKEELDEDLAFGLLYALKYLYCENLNIDEIEDLRKNNFQRKLDRDAIEIFNKAIRMCIPEMFSQICDILKNYDEFIDILNENSKYVILTLSKNNSLSEKPMKRLMQNNNPNILDISILSKISRIPSESFFYFIQGKLEYNEDFLNQILINPNAAYIYFNKYKSGLKRFILENIEWFNEFSKVCDIPMSKIYNQHDIFEIKLSNDGSSEYFELLGKKLIFDTLKSEEIEIKENVKIYEKNLPGFLTYLKCKLIKVYDIKKELIHLKEFKNDQVDNFYSFYSLSHDFEYQRTGNFSIFKTLLSKSDCKLFLKFFNECSDYEKFILYLKLCKNKCNCFENPDEMKKFREIIHEEIVRNVNKNERMMKMATLALLKISNIDEIIPLLNNCNFKGCENILIMVCIKNLLNGGSNLIDMELMKEGKKELLRRLYDVMKLKGIRVS